MSDKKVAIIVPRENKGWFYPILKWRKPLEQAGLQFSFLSKPRKLQNYSHVVYTSRYFQDYYSGSFGIYMDNIKQVIKELIQVRSAGQAIYYYDLSASPAARELKLLPYVDRYLKRQIYSDKTIYLGTHPWSSRFRAWDERTEGWITHYSNQEDLHKIQVAWNLGFSDYNSTNKFLKKLGYINFRDVKFRKAPEEYKYTLTFRGKPTSSQRILLSDFIERQNNDAFLVGKPINRKDFLEELSKSKYTFSPFGYGEICYRDFESVICNSLLLKPNMDHIDTWPDFFQKNKTYVPVAWDLADLEDIIIKLENDLEKVNKIKDNAINFYENNYMMKVRFFAKLMSLFD